MVRFGRFFSLLVVVWVHVHNIFHGALWIGVLCRLDLREFVCWLCRLQQAAVVCLGWLAGVVNLEFTGARWAFKVRRHFRVCIERFEVRHVRLWVCKVVSTSSLA